MQRYEHFLDLQIILKKNASFFRIFAEETFNIFIMKSFGIVALAVAILSCSVMKGPGALKNTTWEYIEEMFVADAGTMTITHTLEFTSANEVKVGWMSYMPAHPAMYMNRDGSVDTIPASHSEMVNKGTYTVGKDKVTITLENGTVKEYEIIKGGMLVGNSDYGTKEVFNRK